MSINTVFYLKINSLSDFSLDCFKHWVEIVEDYGADFYVICDNIKLKIYIEENISTSYKIIPSDYRARDLAADLITPNWMNTACALLTPFIHARENGVSNFFNVDADDTVFLCDAKLCVLALKKVKDYADSSELNCFSLDMHTSAIFNYCYHWTFGITYTKMNVDYFAVLEETKKLVPTFLEKGLIRFGNLDELFTNISIHGLLKLGCYYIENIRFRHNLLETHYYEKTRWIFQYISKEIQNVWKISDKDIQAGIPILEDFVKIDVGIMKSDYDEFIDINNSFLEFGDSKKLPEARLLDLRKELAKHFVLFRNNNKTPIYLWAGYTPFQSFAERWKHILNSDLFQEIDGFIDSDSKKWGTEFKGVPIISPKEIKDDAFIIVSGGGSQSQIERQLIKMGYMHNYNYILFFVFEQIFRRFILSQTRKFQNVHQDKRCFILGNGPSLNTADLEKLRDNKDMAFASNNFHLIFDKTEFRPSYYFIADMLAFEGVERILENPDITVFADIGFRGKRNIKLDNIYFFEQSSWAFYDYYPYHPMFSDDVALSFAAGSITYNILQTAVNMGFTEIYFIGMDFNFPIEVLHDGTLIVNGEADHHFYKNESLKIPCYTKELVISAFTHSRNYCEARGIKIYNTTRGGNLEVFERVDFDSLF